MGGSGLNLPPLTRKNKTVIEQCERRDYEHEQHDAYPGHLVGPGGPRRGARCRLGLPTSHHPPAALRSPGGLRQHQRRARVRREELCGEDHRQNRDGSKENDQP